MDGDAVEFAAAADELGDLRTFSLIAGIFTCVIFDAFPDDPDGAQIAEYARQVVSRLRGAEAPQVVLEAAIRAAFGEPNALAGVTARQANSARVAAIVAHFHGRGTGASDRAQFLTDVTEAMED
jgi:hypothetical protein